MVSFPYLPLMAIMASLVSGMFVQMSVFVYAGFMVEYLGVVDDKDKSGALSTAYMIGRVCSARAWGLLADRRGRRVVLVFGLLSNAILSIVFGCSSTFTMAVMSRFFLGLLNGVMVVSRTLVSEICTTKKHETVGMGFVTSAWTIGGLLGPGIGGLLTEPAIHHPNIFSEHGIFGRYPYLLANLVGAGLSLLALPLVLVFIIEPKTTQSAASDCQTAKARCPSWSCFGGGGSSDKNSDGFNHGLAEAEHASETNAEPAPATEVGRDRKPSKTQPGALETFVVRKPSWMQVEMTLPITGKRNGTKQDSLGLSDYNHVSKSDNSLAQGHIRVLLFIKAMFAFTYSGIDEVFPLWALSSAAKGGLDWTSPQIGKAFFAGGLMVLVFEASLGVPYLTPWLAAKTTQRMASVFEVPVYLLYPLLSYVSDDGHLRFALSVIGLFTAYACINSYALCLNLAFGSAVGKARRAELTGISVTAESVVRAISPMACSALFAFSINGNYPYPFDCHSVFYLLATTRLVAGCFGWNRITDNGNME